MRSLFITLLVLTTMASTAMAQSKPDSALRKSIEPLYARMTTAFLNRDIEAFMAMFAPPGTARQGEKVADPQEVRMRIGMIFAMLKKMTGVKMQIENVTGKGDRAVVVSKYAYQGIIEPEQGKTVKMADRGRMKVTWARTNKGWRILDVDTIESNPTMDGKPISQAAPPGSPAQPSKPSTKK